MPTGEFEIITEEYIRKLDELTVTIQTRSGPRPIVCRDYFTRSRIADIRAMFNESEHRITENGKALHEIHLWLKKAGEDLMKMFRYASVLYGNGTQWHDIRAIKAKDGMQAYEDAKHENLRQDDHLKAAMKLYEKICKALEHEMLLEERNSWIFKDFYEFAK